MTSVDRHCWRLGARLRTIELTWRLGFDLLQRELRGVDEYLPLPNLQKSWLSGSFVDFAHWAVGVKGLTIPPEMTPSDCQL